MSKLINAIIDNINQLKNDEFIRTKIENELVIPIINKSYDKLQPYLRLTLYMYVFIVFLLLLIISIIIINYIQNKK